MSGLDLERLVLSGGPLGLMQAAFDVRPPLSSSLSLWLTCDLRMGLVGGAAVCA